eukprot:TRINITY_DN2844_c0_g5_i1.p1 TRINITY_DN2844_c0_g5~~TRINITY_DN2844_c0_g5_i1.p1  ORF type:complete len:416 (-),score=29.15 TRINITY_DN2844_c0_g5_i1:256-1503(-)
MATKTLFRAPTMASEVSKRRNQEYTQLEGQQEDLALCAICGNTSDSDVGCVHTGHWHSAFGDCGVRCLQVGTNFGRQHWGCCHQVNKDSVGCSRAKHVLTLANSSLREIDASEFYLEYHGHRPDHLFHLVRSLRQQGFGELVWLAGDSTLDNKYWLFPGERLNLSSKHSDYTAAAINGYERVLVPPRMVKDVSYHLNKQLMTKLASDTASSRRIAVVNTSYEEGTLSDRAGDALLPQDAFIRSHIRPQDTLVVSVGGNDVALKPSVKTALSALAMSRLSSLESVEAGRAAGQGHFYALFHTKTKQYIEKLIAKTKPKRVIVCTLYFLDEAKTGSWADRVLGHLGYNDDPARLQAAIRHVFETATSTIEIEGVEVIPVPLFEALDGKSTSDYVSRVEPSVLGGEKMARLLADAVLK